MLCRLLIAGMLLLLPQSDETSRLEQLVEGERGGRQWIDEPTAPPKSPDESRACFQLEPGCRIELFAAEPLVKDPVWIEFDHRGRMFVVEYTDYPTGPADGSEKHLSQIVVLTDRDGNGQADQRTVFAADLDFCHSLLPLFD
ncbi:MAG: hypothetical protein KDA85_19075, partial [Planctomycetaceae bacterium]|nr:hypothetical protein [Planctomycetaceae bacterium]